MFNIGFSELVIIAFVLIILVRPDDLPVFFRKLGRLYAQAKQAYDEVASLKDDFLREMDVAGAIEEAEKAPIQQATAVKGDVSADGPVEAVPPEEDDAIQTQPID